MAASKSAVGRAMFEALREVLGTMSAPDVFGMQLLTALEEGWEGSGNEVKSALMAMAKEYDARRALLR